MCVCVCVCIHVYHALCRSRLAGAQQRLVRGALAKMRPANTHAHTHTYAWISQIAYICRVYVARVNPILPPCAQLLWCESYFMKDKKKSLLQVRL